MLRCLEDLDMTVIAAHALSCALASLMCAPCMTYPRIMNTQWQDVRSSTFLAA